MSDEKKLDLSPLTNTDPPRYSLDEVQSPEEIVLPAQPVEPEFFDDEVETDDEFEADFEAEETNAKEDSV